MKKSTPNKSNKDEGAQMAEREIKAGYMPNTDFYYEEFEGLLASFYLTLLCLKSRPGKDGEAFQQALKILNGFAERNNVRFPEEAAKEPRATKEAWGQPGDFGSCFSLIDMLSSFRRDFSVATDSNTQEGIERLRLGRCILAILHRHDVITAKFQEHEGEQIITGVKNEKPDIWRSLESVLSDERVSL